MAMDSLLGTPFYQPIVCFTCWTDDKRRLYHVSAFFERISMPSLFSTNISHLCDEQDDASKKVKLLHRTGGT